MNFCSGFLFGPMKLKNHLRRNRYKRVLNAAERLLTVGLIRGATQTESVGKN